MTAQEYKESLLSQYTHHKDAMNGKGALPFFQETDSAFERFKTQDFPTRRHEEWKYTSLDRVLKRDLKVAGDHASFQSNWLEKSTIEGLEAYHVVLCNGALVSTDELPNGITLVSARADEFSPEADREGDVFENINRAFANDHIHFDIAANTSIEKPIYITHLVDATANDTLVQKRCSFSVKANAEFTVIERLVTVGDHTSLTNTLTTFDVAEHARVNHIVIQDDGEQSSQVNRTYVDQAKEGVYSNFTYSLSGEIIRNNVEISLNGEYCEGNLYGLYLLAGKEHVDNHTLVDHKVPNCQSNELYKGVLKDHAIGVFNGKVYVRQDAQKTNAYQQNRNLLLSDNATINTKPQLEIWADDVKCSHGATVGQLDMEQLFYLRSRGVDMDTAKSLMVYAFASEIVERVSIEALRQFLFKRISNKLNFNFE